MLRPFALAACLLIAGCGNLTTPTAEQPAEAAAVAEAPPETDYLAQGKQQGYEAAVAAQGAGEAGWAGVATKWGYAIASLGLVPADHPDYATAQAKIAEYTTNQGVAYQRDAAYQAKAAAAPPQEPAKNYRTYTAQSGLTGTTEIEWRWLKGAELECDYGTCFGMEVVAVEGCDNALYVELALEDESDVNIGMTNDTTGKVSAGQKARLIFNTFDESVDSASISEMSCY
ncbi:MAG: hypothetical protein KME14_26115 [Tildeniella torsiva UHER 1998/13D]|jgi:hypothetical protein|nr:hypothetical protein [Tildeniella torsiva UHER 1998/13D]